MPRFGMRKIPHALTAIAAIILAFAGCFAAAAPARAASSLSLVILPDQGENAIYNFVNSAASSIKVTSYELKDTSLVNDLVAREKEGVNVRVIMDRAHQSYDSAAYSAPTAAGAGVVCNRRHLPFGKMVLIIRTEGGSTCTVQGNSAISPESGDDLLPSRADRHHRRLRGRREVRGKD